MTAAALLLLAALAAPLARAGEWEDLADSAALEFASLPSRAPRPEAPPPPLYVREPMTAEVTAEAADGEAEVRRIAFGEGQVLHLHWPRQGVGPLILVLPMTGDPDHKFSRGFCRHFASEGFRCAYLERRLPLDKDLPATLGELFSLPGLPPTSALNARRALDVLEQRGYLRRGDKVGIAGVSLGAIDAALVAATDERIGAAALLLGGADLPRILSQINGAGVKSFARKRKEHMEREHLTLAEFEREMERTTKWGDPLTYFADGCPLSRPDRLAGDRFLMINIKGDPAIPNACSEKLRQAIARGGAGPEYELRRVPVPGWFKHVGAILILGHAKRKMTEHFRRFLGDPRLAAAGAR